MKRRLLLLLTVLGLMLAVPASAETLRFGEPGWNRWGSGEMSWLGFSLYRATLWVAGPSLERSPSALQLEYHREIPSQRLVQTSLDEMRRLGASEAQLLRWQGELQRVFPSVKKGDSIVGVHTPGQGARFYHQGQWMGDVADAEFARRFFSIWLDPASRSPALREALLKREEG